MRKRNAYSRTTLCFISEFFISTHTFTEIALNKPLLAPFAHQCSGLQYSRYYIEIPGGVMDLLLKYRSGSENTLSLYC